MNSIALYEFPVINHEILPSYLAEFYDYLKTRVISCPDNNEQLIERTKELYWEIFCEINEDEPEHNSITVMIPSVQIISDRIDDENLDSISSSCQDAGFSEDDADVISALYCHDIGWMIDTYVGEILWAKGFSANGSADIDKKSRLILRSPFQSGQRFFNFKEVLK